MQMYIYIKGKFELLYLTFTASLCLHYCLFNTKSTKPSSDQVVAIRYENAVGKCVAVQSENIFALFPMQLYITGCSRFTAQSRHALDKYSYLLNCRQLLYIRNTDIQCKKWLLCQVIVSQPQPNSYYYSFGGMSHNALTHCISATFRAGIQVL